MLALPRDFRSATYVGTVELCADVLIEQHGPVAARARDGVLHRVGGSADVRGRRSACFNGPPNGSPACRASTGGRTSDPRARRRR